MVQVLLCITNNSIKHQSFAYTKLNDQTVLFLTIHFCISHLFALSLNVKQFYWPINKKGSIRCYHSKSEWTWEWWQWKRTPHSLKLLTIRLFHVISKTLIGGGEGVSYSSAEMQSVYSTAPATWAKSPLRYLLESWVLQGLRGAFLLISEPEIFNL